MLDGFKQFILRGNVIDLAVAVVIGAAFTSIVNAIVTGVFNPVIGLLFNAGSLAEVGWTVRPEANGDPAIVIAYGAVLAALLQFLIVAAVLYFALVLPINHLKKVAFQKKEEGLPATTKDAPPTELELLADIRDLLARRGTDDSALPSGRRAD